MKTAINSLNRTFGITDHVSFREGAGAFVIVDLNSSEASASVALHGGHVLSFVPEGGRPVLWLSERSRYMEGKAIRGGIPIIWPWFGPHEKNPDLPNHGFARTQLWEFYSARLIDGAHPQIRLTLADDAFTRTLWPYAFQLQLIVTLTSQLQVDLEVRNTDTEPFTFSGALHTYFSISDIEKIAIHGFEHSAYIDQLHPEERNLQEGPISIDAETDRIYVDTESTCVLEDPGFRRRIELTKSGSASTVVWNPWIEKAKRISDMDDEEYRHMVCIETANAGPDRIEVLPRKIHTLSTTLRVLS